MPKNPIATNWDVKFDDKPSSDVPRIKFSYKFSWKYLVNRDLILDIGCGIGSFTRLVDGTGCIAVDQDINSVKTAKKYCPKSTFIVASAMNLPFRAEIFDVVCMWSVFEEIPNAREKQIITEIKKILTPSGVYLLSVYGNHFICKILDPAFIFRGIRHHDPQKFLSLIQELGLFINEYTTRGNLNTIVAIFLVHFYKHILKKKEAMIKNFFDKKSFKEINSDEEGIVYIFIAANKKK
jgi:ubiquinone/menaquinone biosynthesis C-methylase UbiE